MREEDLTVFEMSAMPGSGLPKVIIRNKRGYDTVVSPDLIEKIVTTFGTQGLFSNKVSLYKEAIKYEQYVDFEMVSNVPMPIV